MKKTKNTNKISRAALQSLPADTQMLLLRDALKQHMVRPTQITQWLKDLSEICVDITSRKEESPWTGVFWVRLYGVLNEIHEYYAGLREEMRGVEESASWDAVADSLNNLRNSLSDEDIIIILYQRDCQSHVFQDAYHHRFVNGKLKDRRHVEPLNATYSLKHVVEILERRIKSVQSNDGTIAVDLCMKVQPHLNKVRDAIASLPTLITPKVRGTKARRTVEQM